MSVIIYHSEVTADLHLFYEALRLDLDLLPPVDSLLPSEQQLVHLNPVTPCQPQPAGFVHTDINRTFLKGNIVSVKVFLS